MCMSVCVRVCPLFADAGVIVYIADFTFENCAFNGKRCVDSNTEDLNKTKTTKKQQRQKRQIKYEIITISAF